MGRGVKHIEFQFELEPCVAHIHFAVNTSRRRTSLLDLNANRALLVRACNPVTFEPGANQKFTADMTSEFP